MKRTAVAAAVIAFALSAAAQQPFQERIDVDAVLLDVIVTDSKGNQILGLGKDDFIVTENGVPQTIDSVDYLTSRVLLESREQDAPFDVERVKSERYFVFFFDRPSDPAILMGRVVLAREAVRRFIREEMRENDRVAIAGHDTRLKIYSDFTSDRTQLESALNAASRFGPGLLTSAPGSEPSILRNVDFGETGTVYQALHALADALAPIEARKNLVLFSPGIVTHHETVRSGMIVDRSTHLDPMLESLNAANVAVYGVQLQHDATQYPLFHQRLSEISTSTGGRYYQFNSTFTGAIESIEATNSGYYLLTYRARHPAGDRGFQKVGIAVKNPEFRVVARSGYQFGT